MKLEVLEVYRRKYFNRKKHITTKEQKHSQKLKKNYPYIKTENVCKRIPL